ncbi:hypothetical protein BDZ97DRAFT_1905467 [Flammula alnicola]|nr:hypothetical protein BDZ97DRAFT_1905467 [Flammula alnicola]
MAQNTLDSDLYGDIYGDEENDFEPTHEQEHVEQDAAEGYEESNAQTSSSAPTVDEAAGSSALPQDTHRSLPPKPSVSSPSLLSYSAQVAKQFSAYQQTPSQERQQRKEIPLPQNPRPNSGRPSFTVLSDRAIPSGMSNDTVFGKKPSEMHDAG